jgi:hypothetical protein
VVLQSNQWQGQSWVSVKEKDQWQKARVTRNTRGSHLTVVQLLGFVHVQFCVQSPPLLVVLVDSLATDGQFSSRDRAFREPRIHRSGDGGISVRSQFEVHVRDQITVSGDRDGNATAGRGSTVDSLFDVFHRKVSMAFVNSLEESDFWVTSQVDILGAEETLIEPNEEIEETEEFDQSEEIDENSEFESESGSNVLITDDIDIDEFEDEPYMMDMGGLLSSVLATEDGDTVCSALVNISRQMEVQNKILIKMLSQMQKN